MLEAMNAGGIYDHLGGGYARYSTDAEWLVPHFEKMLYDNAQILELLALRSCRRPDPTFAERARETVGWLMREMRVGDAFAASLDADQDGEEGLFYVWREEDVDAALGDAARRFKAAYDVTRRRQLGRPHRIASHHAARDACGRSRPRGLARQTVRSARGASEPGRDDKVLADWNGLTIAALARASAVFGEPEWLRPRAPRSTSSWTDLRGADGRLLHAWREGTSAPGLARRLCAHGPRRDRAVRGERRARRPRGRAPPHERGDRSLWRRRGRVLSLRKRRRRRARRAPAASA